MTEPATGDPTAELLGGRYALHERIGHGAMADVYRGHDVVLGREVAVKVMRTSTDGLSSAPRARTEMALLASLNHHSLVTLYDAMVEPGRPPYLVMELVEGPTLAARLTEGPMDAGAVALLARQLASALHVVHLAGIVHRDIKPSNILLATDPVPGRPPRAKLADFGVAHIADGQRLTSPGMVVGTAAYLAPEQVRGAAPAPPADVYALGLVLREALTGERAYPDATGIGAVMARLIDAPDVPAWLGPEWTSLLERMIDADPEARPSAAEVADAAGSLPTRLPAPPPPSASATSLPPRSPAALGEFTAAGANGPTHTGRRDRVTRRRRRRTRTLVLIGSTLAVVSVLGAYAATWVGGIGGDVSVRQESPLPTTAPVVDGTDDGVIVVDVADPARSEDAVTTVGTGAETSPRDAKADTKAAEKAARDADKAAEKAARDADKAARDADKAAQKAAEKKAREEKKQERAARG